MAGVLDVARVGRFGLLGGVLLLVRARGCPRGGLGLGRRGGGRGGGGRGGLGRCGLRRGRGSGGEEGGTHHGGRVDTRRHRLRDHVHDPLDAPASRLEPAGHPRPRPLHLARVRGDELRIGRVDRRAVPVDEVRERAAPGGVGASLGCQRDHDDRTSALVEATEQVGHRSVMHQSDLGERA
ncbi:hypothetical protein FL583_32035 [Cryptosporangium phraense]|uniref:Uncharacterized protein n=1 Tax=Cryptosporangium phraense TaxID=2593070 RepID=A0A545AI57_9ACTN|nr:hypothetical protein FL583_32035 [Cryptosporangium phraense]